MSTPEPPADGAGAGRPAGGYGGTTPPAGPDAVHVEVDAEGLGPDAEQRLQQAVADAVRQAGTGNVEDLGKAVAAAVAVAAGSDDAEPAAATGPAASVLGEGDGRSGLSWLPKGRIIGIGIAVVVVIVVVNVGLRVFDIVDSANDIVRDLDVPDVTPRADTIDLVGDGAQIAAAIDEIVAANGGADAVDVTAYPDYLLACMVAPDDPARLVGYRYDAHGLQETGTLCVAGAGLAYSTERVDWTAVADAGDAALAELDGAPGEVTHVIVDRTSGPIEIRAYFRAESGTPSGYVLAARDGTVQRVYA